MIMYLCEKKALYCLAWSIHPRL